MPIYTYQILEVEKVPTERYGRKCKWPGCRTILSIYNHNCCCGLHQPKVEFLKKTVLVEQIQPVEVWKRNILKAEARNPTMSWDGR